MESISLPAVHRPKREKNFRSEKPLGGGRCAACPIKGKRPLFESLPHSFAFIISHTFTKVIPLHTRTCMYTHVHYLRKRVVHVGVEGYLVLALDFEWDRLVS